MLNYSILAIFILYILTITGFGQQRRIRSQFIDQAPEIDGHLGIAEWPYGDSNSVFIQMEPHKGRPATEKTILYVGFDNDNLYFAFQCLDRQADKIVYNIRSRDKLEKSDDAVMLILDTYLDRRSGYAFMVNPAGTQTDIRIADDGRSTDINWDTRWQAAAGLYEWGWVAEIVIPFSSISYNEDLTVFGVNFGRIIRKNSETSYWSGLINSDFRLSQGGIIEGLSLPEKQKRMTFTPYTTLRYERSTMLTTKKHWFSDFGGDLGYQISSDILLNLTINPDFATVEGDQERINLTRWELSFPEKRLFFLEGNELYSTRIRTFYSRRIGDIDYGAKVLGKSGDYTFTALAVKTAADTLAGQPEAAFSTVRIKKNILESSTIGITFAGKDWQKDNTHSLSADYVLNLGNSWKLTGQFVMSTPGDFWNSSAWFVRFARESNIYHYHIRYSDTGENFRDNVNQTGFIRDADMREIDADINYRWWSDSGLLQYIYLSTKNNIFWNHEGTLRSWYVTESARVYFYSDFSIDVAYNNEYKLYEKKYYNQFYRVEWGYNTDEWSNARLEYITGKNFDRNFILITPGVQFQLFDDLSLSYEHKYLKYDPDPSANSTNINIFIADYNFTRDIWIRLLAQNNSGEDRLYLYGLFAWRFQPPFGAIYFIYTSDEVPSIFSPIPKKNQIVFLKLAYQLGI